MEEAARVAAGRAVPQGELDLLDAERRRVHRVDRHPRLRAEAGCERKDGGRARAATSARWPESGSARLEARSEAGSARGRRAFAMPEAATLALGERRDPQAL